MRCHYKIMLIGKAVVLNGRGGGPLFSQARVALEDTELMQNH